MSERPVLLDDAEAAVLCMELEHAPSCVWTTGAQPVVDDHTPDCTCGYFALLDRAREKVRASREIGP